MFNMAVFIEPDLIGVYSLGYAIVAGCRRFDTPLMIGKSSSFVIICLLQLADGCRKVNSNPRGSDKVNLFLHLCGGYC